MRKLFLIITLFLSHACFAESKWGLSEDTENRLTKALKIVERQKPENHSKAGINFVTVGDDGGCDFRVGASRIQGAIDSGAQEIRISSNASYFENIVIDTIPIDLTIRGGFTDCVQAQNNIQLDAEDDWIEINHVDGQVNSVINPAA